MGYKYMSVIIEIYRQCHDHLKETDKKRDQLVGFFLVVVGLVFNNIDSFSEAYQRTISFGVAIAGLFVLLTVIHYRKWHILYVRCIQFLNIYLQVNDFNITIKEYNKKYKIKWTSWINPFASTEVSIFYLITVIAFMPFQLYIDTAHIAFIKLHTQYNFLPVMLNLLVFLVVMNFIAFFFIRKANNKDMLSIWLLYGLRD